MAMVTDEGIRPADLGRAVEERGFDSLFVPEHSHIPVGAEVPLREFARLLDPLVTLTAAASATSRLLLGTAVLVVSQRDPIQTAKEAATLDLISDGRFVFGFGVGWLREEIAGHGTDPRVRGRVTDERMHAIRGLWLDETAEFHGEHVDFGPVHAWPKPVQHPHPPIYVGGDSPATHRRIAAYGDGWLANPLPGPAMADRIAALTDHIGRAVPVTVTAVPPDPGLLAAYAALGVERVALRVPTAPRDETLRALDNLADLVASSGLDHAPGDLGVEGAHARAHRL
jgi:probable F420-dependent oxidoreductase